MHIIAIEDVKHASARKKKKGRPKQRWLDTIWDDMEACKMTEDMAQNQSVWHMKLKAGPLLHGADLLVGMLEKKPRLSFALPPTCDIFFSHILYFLYRHKGAAYASQL